MSSGDGFSARFGPWAWWRRLMLRVGHRKGSTIPFIPSADGESRGHWTRDRVREVVRATIIEEVGVSPDFDDQARLVGDLGIN